MSRSPGLVRLAFGLFLVAAVAFGCLQSGKSRPRRDAGAGTQAGTTGTNDPPPPEPPCPCNDRWHAGEVGHEVAGLAAEGTPVDGGEITMHMDSEPPHMLYMLRPDAWVIRIVGHDVLECLVRVNPRTYAVEPELAETFETSADGKTITFRLRKGVKWHDGRPFTSADVKFTFDRLFDDQVEAGGQRGDFIHVERWEAPDEHTFVLHLREVQYSTIMNLEKLHILAQHVYERGDINTHPANRQPIGTGPYRFVHWKAGDEILLQKNRSYWGKGGHLDRIRYKIVRDRAVAFEMARRGELDYIWRLQPEQVSDGIDDAIRRSYRVVQHYPAMFGFWIWNTKRPYFADVKNRQAMTMLLNRPQIRCAVERCLARVLASPYPFVHPSFAKNLQPWPYHPARAERILDENGWRDSDGDGVRDKVVNGKKVPFRFTFLATANSTSLQRQAAIVKQDLRRSGIDMEIQINDWAAYIERMQNGEFDAGSFLQYPDVTVDFYSLFHSSQVGPGMQNHGAYKNARVDRLLEQVRRTLDAEQRYALERELQGLLYEDQPWTFSMGQIITGLLKKKFRGYYSSLQYWQERDFWIAPEDR